MAAKVRVHELAKELGLTNKEAVDLCISLGIGIKTHSSSIEEAQGDRLRRKAHKDGLVRDHQPEEPVKPKKGAIVQAVAAIDPPAPVQSTATAEATPAPIEAVAPAAVVTQPAAARPPVATAPVAPPPPVVVAPVPPVPVPPVPVPAVPVRPVEPLKATVISSTRPDDTRPVIPRPAGMPPAGMRPVSSAASTSPAPPVGTPAPASVERPVMPDRPAVPRPPGRPPLSATGRPVPPPPLRPTSVTGRPIPPPPGRRPDAAGAGVVNRPGGRAGGPARPGGFAGRPAGAGGPARPGGFAPRPGGPPGAPGGPGGGPGGAPGGGGQRPGGGRPNSQRRPAKRKSARRRRRGDELSPTQMSYSATDKPVPTGVIVVERGSSAQDFSPKLNRMVSDVVRFLLQNGEMVTATQALSDEQMELYALELGAELLLVEPGQQEELELQAMFNDDDDDDPELQQPRSPVVTVMGHVDHGKTTLLDRIRQTNVVAGEAGGITQHIGAYQARSNGHLVTFIDTPGHAAFSKMRARGAQVTDIVVLVVAADDGVMPQTIEAINHAKAAEVPIIVAVNKIDKENADPQRVLAQLAEYELVPESWGGDTIVVEMSASQNLGVDDLLEQLVVVAEVEDLTANPDGRAKGIVLEAKLDVGRGPVATVLVDKGTLKVGDPIVAGHAWGRVRALINDKGEQVKSAGPSTPVQVLGLQAVPFAGDEFRVAPDERTARTVADAREQRLRLRTQRGDARVGRGVKLEDVFAQIQRGEVATLNLIIKADVQGSLEALTESLRRLERDDVKLSFVHRAVGGVSENDITLAAATNSTIIGFNVRPDRKARALAETEGVEIRAYEVIYNVLDDMEKAMVGLLAPEFIEVVTGDAEVREVFRVPKIGAIAGCQVRNGVITRGSKVRFLREGTIIWKGAINSLKRFKEDAREVREGFECGIGLSDFQDLKPGDIIETFEEREIPRT